MKTNPKTVSRFLSKVLRHQPEAIGLELDPQGWASVDELLQKMQGHDFPLDLELLTQVVDTNNKQRFAFNEAKTHIRANQGHSIPIQLDYQAVEPPEILYHGTAEHVVESIRKTGLEKRSRHHVHLSLDRETAQNVGSRHGKPVVFEVLAGEMFRAGHEFFCSKNEVWLTDHVPTAFLR